MTTPHSNTKRLFLPSWLTQRNVALSVFAYAIVSLILLADLHQRAHETSTIDVGAAAWQQQMSPQDKQRLVAGRAAQADQASLEKAHQPKEDQSLAHGQGRGGARLTDNQAPQIPPAVSSWKFDKSAAEIRLHSQGKDSIQPTSKTPILHLAPLLFRGIEGIWTIIRIRGLLQFTKHPCHCGPKLRTIYERLNTLKS